MRSRLAVAMPYYERAAELGDAHAQFRLALAYFRGEGGKRQNNKQAAEWYERATAQLHLDAAYNLGWLYDKHGVNGHRDPAAAVQYYRIAAEHGHSDAQYNLGLCYLHGDGISKDKDLAAELFQEAAASGCLLASQQLALREQVKQAKVQQKQLQKRTDKNTARKRARSSGTPSKPAKSGKPHSLTRRAARSSSKLLSSVSAFDSPSSNVNPLDPLEAQFELILQQAGLLSIKDKLVDDGADLSTLELIHEHDLVRHGIATLKARRAIEVIRKLLNLATADQQSGAKRQRAA